jgi:dihydroneopterin triphosphate diphosphatase
MRHRPPAAGNPEGVMANKLCPRCKTPFSNHTMSLDKALAREHSHPMARAPFQVLVYPYRKTEDGQFEYALMKRSDQGFWQAIAGGGEDQETPQEAARRETYEEAGIPPTSEFLQLDTVEPVPVIEFGNSHLWGDDLYVIPQYCFGVKAQNVQIVLSHEHTEYRWLSYEGADQLLKYDGNKTALWELDRRLKGKGPRG